MRYLLFVYLISTFACRSQQLPAEPVHIQGGSMMGGGTAPIVETTLGSKKQVSASDSPVGLFHLLILPPQRGLVLEYSSSQSDSGIDPTTLSYRWNYSDSDIVRFSVSYSPATHSVTVGEKVYSLSKGNMFLADVRASDDMQFRQLSARRFDIRKAVDALRAFKAALPKTGRVQAIRE